MIISEYFSEDGTRSAVVLKDNQQYVVVMIGVDINKKMIYNHLSLAEDCAEDFVND